MGEEIELKLEIAESAIPQLLKCDALRRRKVRFRPARRLVTTYYDTPKGALRSKGLFLRIREDGKTITQTVKTAGQGGVLAARGEWNWPLSAAEPDLAVLAATGQKFLVKRARKDGLRAIFASEIARRIAIVTESGGTLELALDKGLVRAGRRTAPLSELEIEVKSGAPSAVFPLARDLMAQPGVRIGLETKAARGFALAAGVKPGAVRAGDLGLTPDMTIAEAEAAILRSCATQIAANLPAVLDLRLPDGVHQMRVALRRLRAALVLFKDTLPPDIRKRLRGQAGALATALGPARDLDVLMTGPLKAALPPDDLAADIRLLTASLARARRDAWQAVIAAASSPELGLLVLDLTERAAVLDAEGRSGFDDAVTLKDMARGALEDRYDIVLALGASIDSLPVLQRHELRLALKKLRYAADFFAGLFPHKHARSGIKALAGLQDAFGGFNDAASTAMLLDGAVGGAPPKSRAQLERAALFIKGWASHRADLAWASARESWDAFAGRKPFWR